MNEKEKELEKVFDRLASYNLDVWIESLTIEKKKK